MRPDILENAILQLVADAALLKTEVGNIKQTTVEIKESMDKFDRRLQSHTHKFNWSKAKQLLIVISSIVGSGGIVEILHTFAGK